MKLIFFYKSRD